VIYPPWGGFVNHTKTIRKVAQVTCLSVPDTETQSRNNKGIPNQGKTTEGELIIARQVTITKKKSLE